MAHHVSWSWIPTLRDTPRCLILPSPFPTVDKKASVLGVEPILFSHRSFHKPAISTVFDGVLEKRIPGKNEVTARLDLYLF